MRTIAFSLALSAVALPAQASDTNAAMQAFLDSDIRSWANSAVLVDAIRAQNGATTAYSQADIDALDQAWRAEVGTANRPTIDPVLDNAASDFLRTIVADAGGAITEIFVMDARGLNVAASDVTSDFWQGERPSLRKHSRRDRAVCISAISSLMNPAKAIRARSPSRSWIRDPSKWSAP